MVVSSVSIQREKTAAGFTQGHSYARFLKILFKVINLILVALSQSASTTVAFASSLKRWKILPDGLLCIYFCLKQNSEPQGKVHLSDSQNKSACIAIHRGAAGEKLAPERHQMVGVELTRDLLIDAGGNGQGCEFLAWEPGSRFGACIFTHAPKENEQPALNTLYVWKMAQER